MKNIKLMLVTITCLLSLTITVLAQEKTPPPKIFEIKSGEILFDVSNDSLTYLVQKGKRKEYKFLDIEYLKKNYGSSFFILPVGKKEYRDWPWQELKYEGIMADNGEIISNNTYDMGIIMTQNGKITISHKRENPNIEGKSYVQTVSLKREEKVLEVQNDEDEIQFIIAEKNSVKYLLIFEQTLTSNVVQYVTKNNYNRVIKIGGGIYHKGIQISRTGKKVHKSSDCGNNIINPVGILVLKY